MAMSVITSNRSSVGSILKGSRVNRQLFVQRVRFQLPSNLKSVLHDFINKTNSKPYEELVCIIRDSDIKDEDLQTLLQEAKSCIFLLDKNTKHFAQAVLGIPWIQRGHEVVKEYQMFLIDLLSAHNYYTNVVLEMLVSHFVPDGELLEWENNSPPQEVIAYYANIHKVLKISLQVVPMAHELLLQVVSKEFPYLKRGALVHQYYIHNLLKIIEYQPQLRLDLLQLIISRLVALDVNAPRSAIEDTEDNFGNDMEVDETEVFAMENELEVKGAHKTALCNMKHPIAHTLDVALSSLFCYFDVECHECDDSSQLNWERTKGLYHSMISVFEKIILPTHATYHIQFLMFYLCSFKVTLAEAFLNFLWRKVSSPHEAVVARQVSVYYMASLLARATYIPISILKGTIAELSIWIQNYISSQDSFEYANSGVRAHGVFYGVCQALFYIIAFRHKDLVNTRKNLTFLQSLNLTKIVTCSLNPLKVCLPPVVQNFAAVTRTYQLAYCYTIIEHNARSKLPVIHTNDRGAVISRSSEWLDTFFPFDPYLLRKSGTVITPLYREYQSSELAAYETEALHFNKADEEEEEDDFLKDLSPAQPIMSIPVTCPDLFSYSMSPGFKHM